MRKKNKIVLAFITFLALTILTWVVAKPFRISGDCMEPAIKDGKLYFLNQLTPYISRYKIGDIIVFTHEDKPWIARIVALGNNTIHIKEGTILVDGLTLNDKIKRNWQNWDFGTYAIDKAFMVPKKHVFVLSDNLSAQHDDSRVFGPIDESSILGVVW